MIRQTPLVAIIAYFAIAVAGTAVSAPIDLPLLRHMRTKAAHRTRHMIFNNDGDDVIYYAKTPTPEALLAARTSPLLGSQVDSIFYSNSLCFGDALHNSKVFAPFVRRDGICKNNILPGLIAKGMDPIQIIAAWGHKHGVEVFWDMRMNDTHDAMIGGYGPVFRTKLKLDHPEYTCGVKGKPPPQGSWTSIDYTRPEVRELCYRFFEEVCQRFDVDGVEMDFFRHPCFFKSVAWGKHASQAELDMMTALLRRIRGMTEREGMRRGRPILIAIRVPDSVEYCRGIGLDLETWLKDGLVDILVGSGYFRLNHWTYLVQLGHQYGVPVYACLSDSRVRTDTRFNRRSIESYRGRAMRAWSAGVDGIYIFNYFNPRGHIWRELGDPAALRKMPKCYFVTVRDGNPRRYLADGLSYRRLPILTPNNPKPIRGDEPLRVEMTIGDDLAQTQRDGLKPVVTCHAEIAGAAELATTLNGHALPTPKHVDDWLDYAVRPEWVKQGVNTFTFQCPPRDSRGNEWGLVYKGAGLPKTPWRKMGFRKDCIAEMRDGKLLLADRGTTNGTYAFYRAPCPIRRDDKAIVEVRMKPISGWSSVIIENGDVYEEVQFFTDKIKSRASGLTYAMNTTDRFHTYRIVLKGHDFQVYVDGKRRLDGPGKTTQPAYNGRSGIAFGAANSGSVGEALWESVKVNTDAAGLLDLALSVEFE